MTPANTTSLDGEYASAIADAIESAAGALNEARLPIHILLTAQFGELNDNQEEMLRAAEAALGHIADELRALRSVATSQDGDDHVERQSVRINDILEELLPQLRDQATRAGVLLKVNVEPAMPAIVGTFGKLRDALRITILDEIRYAAPGSAVNVDAYTKAGSIIVTSGCGASRSATAALLLAKRLLGTQGATLDQIDGQTVIALAPETTRARP